MPLKSIKANIEISKNFKILKLHFHAKILNST